MTASTTRASPPGPPATNSRKRWSTFMPTDGVPGLAEHRAVAGDEVHAVDVPVGTGAEERMRRGADRDALRQEPGRQGELRGEDGLAVGGARLGGAGRARRGQAGTATRIAATAASAVPRTVVDRRRRIIVCSLLPSLIRSGCNPWLPLVSTVEPRERIHRRGTSVEVASRRHRFDQVAQRSPDVESSGVAVRQRGVDARPGAMWQTPAGRPEPAGPLLHRQRVTRPRRRVRRRERRRSRRRARPAGRTCSTARPSCGRSGTAAAGCPPSRGRSATGRSRTSSYVGSGWPKLLRPAFLPMPASSSAGETARPRRP